MHGLGGLDGTPCILLDVGVQFLKKNFLNPHLKSVFKTC